MQSSFASFNTQQANGPIHFTCSALRAEEIGETSSAGRAESAPLVRSTERGLAARPGWSRIVREETFEGCGVLKRETKARDIPPVFYLLDSNGFFERPQRDSNQRL